MIQRTHIGAAMRETRNSRKPACHNGTAWTWFLPQLCEAILQAWPHDENALKAANSYLDSLGKLLDQGFLGQLPEILDGDAHH